MLLSDSLKIHVASVHAFYYLFIFIYVFMYMCVLPACIAVYHICAVLLWTRRGIRSPETGDTDGFGALCAKNQNQVLLTNKTSIHPSISFLIKVAITRHGNACI